MLPAGAFGPERPMHAAAAAAWLTSSSSFSAEFASAPYDWPRAPAVPDLVLVMQALPDTPLIRLFLRLTLALCAAPNAQSQRQGQKPASYGREADGRVPGKHDFGAITRLFRAQAAAEQDRLLA